MNSNANVVAMSIAAMVVVAAMAALIVTFYQTQPPAVPINTAMSETQISLRKAVSLGISKWAEKGFDKQDATWYNNANYPPSLSQAKNSLKEMVNEEIIKALGELKTQRGYNYIFENAAKTPIIEFDSDSITSIDGLNKESIKVKVSGFSIQGMTEKITTTKSFETEEKFDYSVWDLYSKMYEWAENDSGNISANLESLLDSTPYQLQLCDCGVITKTTESSVILAGSTTWEDRKDPKTGATIIGVENAVLKPALEDLKSKFEDNPNIKCNYIIENKVVENIPNIIKRGQAGCECAGGKALENSQSILSSTVKAWRTDSVGKPAQYYGVEGRENVAANRGFETIESFLRIERSDPIPPLTYSNCSDFNAAAGDQALCNAGQMCFATDQQCIDNFKAQNKQYLTIKGDNEAIGMTKRIASIVRFKCEDTSSKAKTEQEFKNLSSEIVVRFAILKGAQPPEFCTTEDGPICLYGAKCCIVGLECTPWDDCFLNPQDSAACGVCECMIGSKLISPIGDPVAQSLWDAHEGGLTYNCLNSDDPACKWCNSKGGQFKCPAKIEAKETTAECNTLLDGIISGGKSEQCVLYKCLVEEATSTVKRGCVFTDSPIPCDSCRRCSPDGTCVPDEAKIGQPCNPPAGSPAGAVQDCYQCNSEGSCVVNELGIGKISCSNSSGCITFCNDNGTCTKYNETDVGKNCPQNLPDYLCKQCKVLNNKLSCTSTCANGCCSDNVWGRCIGTDGKCCPETHTLTKCPGAT